MMMKYITVLIAFFSLLLCSCKSDDSFIVPAGQEEVSLYFSTKVPLINQHGTRAVQEDLISNINVLVFEEVDDVYTFTYQVPGYALENISPTQYDFYARLATTGNPVKLFLLANVPGVTDSLTGGETEEEVRTGLTGVFTENGFDGALPMFGEVEFPGGLTEDEEVSTFMIRSVAKVEVVNNSSNFILTTIQLYRASDQYQIIPTQLVNDRVTEASIPAGTTQSVNTLQLNVEDNASDGQIYLPESPLPDEAGRRQATVVVVGGKYESEEAPTTYFRLDFVPDVAPELFGQILRNHRYRFQIDTVMAPGWRTPDEAANNISTQIEVEVKVWDESTTYMVFDNVYYFGVSTRDIRIPAPAGSQQTVAVDTNLESYELYWTDAAGNIDPEIDPITLGETFLSGDEAYRVSISDDGTRIIAVGNEIASQATGYLLAVAGRLRVQLTITQGTLTLNTRPLNVYGRLGEIGALGDYVFSNGTEPRERARGMSAIMRNPANFGFAGRVPIERINVSGQVVEFITAELMSLFDVMYLPYPYNPGPVYTNRILNWNRANDRRVLIVHYDNSTTNATMLDSLGIATADRIFPNATTPYTVYQQAPSQITEGVFGSVSYGMQYRCYDNIHGEIELQAALNAGISPILIGNGGGVSLGVDFNRRIVYSGDIDLYSNLTNQYTGQEGLFISSGGIGTTTPSGVVVNDAEQLIANLWAWITTVVLED